MSERIPTDVLVEQARESATILRADLSGPHLADLLTALADRLAELAALERELSDPEQLAQRFHSAYERLAPQFGYDTRADSAVPWEHVPCKNKLLMLAVATEIARGLLDRP